MKTIKWVLLISIIAVLLFGIVGYHHYLQQNGSPEAIIAQLEQAMIEFEPETIANIVNNREAFALYWNERTSFLSEDLQGYVMERAKDLHVNTNEIVYIDDSHAKATMNLSYIDGENSVKEDYRNYFDGLYHKHYYSFEKSPEAQISDYVNCWRSDELVIYVFPGERSEQKITLLLTKTSSIWRIDNDAVVNRMITKALTCGTSEGIIAAYQQIANIERADKARRRGYGSQGSGYSRGASSATSTSTRQQKSSTRAYGRTVYNADSNDSDDYDVEGFYYDNRSDFENMDDAADYLEDEPDEWD